MCMWELYCLGCGQICYRRTWKLYVQSEQKIINKNILKWPINTFQWSAFWPWPVICAHRQMYKKIYRLSDLNLLMSVGTISDHIE